MNNLSSYCGLVDVRINAFDKDLPVTEIKHNRATYFLRYFQVADYCNRKPNRKALQAPKEEEARAIPVRTEAVARPRGAYYYSPEAQEWIRIKF